MNKQTNKNLSLISKLEYKKILKCENLMDVGKPNVYTLLKLAQNYEMRPTLFS